MMKKLMICLTLLLVIGALTGVALADKSTTGGILDDTRFPDMALRQALADKYGDAHN